MGLSGLAAALLTGRDRGDAANNDCAHFCTAAFGPGRERGRCVNDAARDLPGNLCAACGADTARLCVAPDGGRTCCAGADVCDETTGACQPPPPDCETEICDEGICCPAFHGCCPDETGANSCLPLFRRERCGDCDTTCDGPSEVCCSTAAFIGCGLARAAQCDPANDRCCTTLTGSVPNTCRPVPDFREFACCHPSNIGARCPIDEPALCTLDADCPYCCSGYCDAAGFCNERPI